MTFVYRLIPIALLLLIFNSCEKEKSADNSKIVKRDNAEINYRDTGEGGATLLFIHGAFIDQTYWDAQVKYFSSDYRVVTFDLPGHGKSGKNRPHWSVQGYAGDVYTLIKRLNLKNVILVGHSLGGDIALMAATYRPKNVIGFIGIDTFKDAAMPLPIGVQQHTDKFLSDLKKDFSATNERFARQALVTAGTPSEISSRVINDFRKADTAMAGQIMPQVFSIYKTQQRLMPQLKLKMHLINVDYFPTREAPLAKYAGNGYDVRHMKGTSHYPMLENPDELNRLLRITIEEIARENDQARPAL